jgi:hypothetical protein
MGARDVRRRNQEGGGMSSADFLLLPFGARVLFALMLWPAIWAGALLIGALAEDLERQAHARLVRTEAPRVPRGRGNPGMT